MKKIFYFAFTMLAVASFLLSTIPTSTQAASFSDGLSAFNEEDYETAFKIWKSVAKKGNPKAQFRLATMYRKGIGIPKNHKKAIRWFLMAAKQEKSGFSEPFRAQMNLGHYYQMGDAVNENKVIALKWYLSASKGFRLYDFRRGTRISAKMIEKIKKDMSEEEISQAEKLAYQWEEKQKNSSQKSKAHTKSKKTSGTLYYWANYKSEELSNIEGDEEWTIEIKYSEDGKKYEADVIFVPNSGGRGSGPCKGSVDSKGNLEKKVCDLDDFSERTLSGNIVRIELLNTGGGSSGGAVWFDKKMAAKKKEIETKLQKELARKKREAELARKKKQAEMARKSEIARKKREAELARKKRFEELRKKREAELARKKKQAELARKKKQAELARKKEIARKKLLAKRKLEAEKKRQRIIAAKKRKRELLLKLFPPLSLEANKLSNDIQLYLQKNPDTPNLIEIATLIGKIKQSQKRKEVLRLKKSIKTLRTLLAKVKGFSTFETKRNEVRKIAKLKLLNKKIKSGKDLKNFLRSYVAKNMLNDSKTVQKILPFLKKLDSSLKSPKLDELNILIPKIQKFILTTSSLRKAVVKLRKNKELTRKRELEAKRTKQMEIIRKRELVRQKELEAKRTKQIEAKQKEADKKKLLAVQKKAKELKRKSLPKENKPKKKAQKMDDFQISEIVQKKIKENKFKEAKLYANKIQDPDIRNLFLKNIQLQDHSKTDKKNHIRVKKKKSSKPHILFELFHSRDYKISKEKKDGFGDIENYILKVGCTYQLKITNKTKEKFLINSIHYNAKNSSDELFSERLLFWGGYPLKPGEYIQNDEFIVAKELKSKKPFSKTKKTNYLKNFGCKTQKDKINFTNPDIKFRKNSRLNKDVYKLIRQTSPLTPK